MKFFQLSPSQVAEQLNTDILEGLDPTRLDERQEIYGKNELNKHKENFSKSRLLGQFKDPTIIILLIVATISAVASVLQRNYEDLFNTFIIVAIVIVSGLIRVLRLCKAEKAITALKKFTIPKANVIRGGQVIKIKSVDLVPGDIVLLQSGDMVHADGRIIECSFLKVDESVLTKKSLPAEKSAAVIIGDNHSIENINNMVFSGSVIISGTAKIIVTSIGMETQIGKAVTVLQCNEQEKTTLQTQIEQMGKVLSLLASIICGVILVLGIVEGKPIIDMLLTVVLLAVALIPEGLLSTVTDILSFGVSELFRTGVIVNRLSIVETLGNIEVICTDKTGTLTKNEMSVVSCYVNDEHIDFIPKNYKKCAEIILYGSMCNDAFLKDFEDKKVCVGDPTEGAIISALEKFGKSKFFLDKQYPKMGVIPFDKDRKCKSSVNVIDGRNLVIVKGTSDVIFKKCINQTYVNKCIEAEAEMEKSGLRVLAIAVKEIDVIPSELFVEEIESELKLVGLIGMTDVLQEKTSYALNASKKAGIRTIMFSGDHSIAAVSAAEQMDIFSQGDIVLTGQQLEGLSDEEFLSCIKKCSVYSRISPKQRLRVVQTWQNLGKTVAVTGEGLDDTAALRRANIGCAMGTSGVDIAKNVADVVLLDDSFASIVFGIHKSRNIYSNIVKTVSFLISANLSQVFVVLLALLMLFNVPLLPLHLLWINVVTSALPALALGTETACEGLMGHPPHTKNNNIITKSIIIDILWQGLLIAIVSLFGYVIGTGFEPQTQNKMLLSTGQTMTFAILALSQIFYAFDFRSKYSIFEIKLFSNKHLNLSALISIASLLFVMLVPGVSRIFGVVSLRFVQWILILGLSLLPFVIREMAKLIKKR